MIKRKVKGVLLGVVTLLSFLFLCGIWGNAMAAEKVKLRIGKIMQFTGPMAGGQVGFAEGFTDAVEAVNKYMDFSGGYIEGTLMDGGSDAAKAMSAFKQLTEGKEPIVVMVGQSTGIAIALKKWNIRKMTPNVEAGADDELFRLPSWTFSTASPYVNGVGAWIDYYMANIWPKKNLKRAPRFAFLTWDNAFGRSCITKNTIDYIKSKGIEIVGEEYIPLTPTDVGAQVMRLLDKGVDFTAGNMYHNALAVVLKEMDKLGAIDKIDINIGYAMTPIALLDAVNEGGTKDLARNVYLTSIYRDFSEWEKQAPRFLEFYKKNKRTVPPFGYGMGFNMGLVAMEAVRIAAKTVGPEKVDGTAVYNALQTMKNFDTWGIGPPITYSETKRYGKDSVYIQKMNNNKVTTIALQPTPDLTNIKK